MPNFSNTNDKAAITAISVKILFFLMKSIMNINNLIFKFLYRRINKNIISIKIEPIYLVDLLPSIASSKKLLKNVIKV